ncbi:MAG: triose-phosphate transporter family protein [Clostridiales bacterium]|nr:triose-phosphate transporter family protein [Clostridiales bacterium]
MDSSIFTVNVCYGCAFIAVLVSSASQILLKKQANNETKRKGFIWKFLDWKVIFAYGFMFLSLALNQVALIQVPVSVLPCITATSFLWIFLFSAIFLKEKPTRRKVLGVIIILAGVAISRL